MPAAVSTSGPQKKIEPPYYPIVYVRGYAMTAGERDQVFHDAYYGFGISSVEKRQAPPPKYFEADIFEGLLIRLIKDHEYLDPTNRGFRRSNINPSRSIWISRFYDIDFFKESVRPIEAHAQELYDLIVEQIPNQLRNKGVDVSNYKVILIAHSMGGLVCRAFLQKLLPENNKDPKEVVHRFITMGTPHRGIELGAVPDILEDRLVTTLNPFDAAIFKEDRMREYLNLKTKNNGDYVYDVHSLGTEGTFPVKRCLCIVGSDWSSYGVVRKLTGGHSDGLVKQDRAYMVSGPRPPSAAASDNEQDYDEKNRAFWANIHRAHSGFRGIVNSYESYENIQRFLFGDTIFRLYLDSIELGTKRNVENTYFYDFEFLLSIRGTTTYLHRREQDPCENAVRIKLDANATPPKSLFLHVGFMNSKYQNEDDPYSYFRLTLRVAEHRVRRVLGLLWDHEYPASEIYNETVEARIGDSVEYRWLADVGDQADGGWRTAAFFDGQFRFPLRGAKSFAGELVVSAGSWPDADLTKD
jgi:pimeloyl-ACP methyl ester carboxylesterase